MKEQNKEPFKFDDIIHIQGRIPDSLIKLIKVDQSGGYFPGIYYDDYLYKDERNTFWWLRKDFEDEPEFGQKSKDWTFIDESVAGMIHKSLKANDCVEHVDDLPFTIAEDILFNEKDGWIDESCGNFVGWTKQFNKFAISISRESAGVGGTYHFAKMLEGYRASYNWHKYLITERGFLSYRKIKDILEILKNDEKTEDFDNEKNK